MAYLPYTFMIMHPIFLIIISKLLVKKDPCLTHYCNPHIPNTVEVSSHQPLLKE